MILQYFNKKENKDQIIAAAQYKKIINESSLFLNIPFCAFLAAFAEIANNY